LVLLKERRIAMNMKKKHVNNKYLDWKVRHLLFNIRIKRNALFSVYDDFENIGISPLTTIQLLNEYYGEINQMISDAYARDYINDYQRDLLSLWCRWYLHDTVCEFSFKAFINERGTMIDG
jgi:hypothetical protein